MSPEHSEPDQTSRLLKIRELVSRIERDWHAIEIHQANWRSEEIEDRFYMIQERLEALADSLDHLIANPNDQP